MRRVITMMGLFVAVVLMPALGSAQEAELSAEIGWVSEYYYRGIPQKPSSASAGLELGVGGLYVGTWAADVGEGNEVDVYAGYIQDFGDLFLGAGAIGYFYTGDFDDPYLELNLFAGGGPVEIEFSVGQWDTEPEKADYTFLGVTFGHEGAYGTIGTFGGDFSGTYAEVGYGFEVGGFDLNIGWVWSDEELSGLGKSDNTLIFGLGTTIDLL